MSRLLAILALLAFGIPLLTAEDEAPPTEGPTIVQKLCPVMTGNKINPKLFVEQDGKRIYVCCQGCITEVKKDFAKYEKLVEEQIAMDAAAATTWTCTMHPDVKQDHAGKCLICAMDLVPVTPATKEATTMAPMDHDGGEAPTTHHH